MLAADDLMAAVLAEASRQTGLPSSRLRELAAEAPEVPAAQERPSRATVARRGVPERHLRSVYDREPEECQALAAVRSWLLERTQWLILSGAPGLCKSGSAAWALTQRTSGGYYLRAADLPQLAVAEEEDRRATWRWVQRADLLVLDDLGTAHQGASGWSASALELLLTARYDSCERTLITTNLDAAAFADLVGPRIIDRMRESARFVRLSGDSVRPGKGRP